MQYESFLVHGWNQALPIIKTMLRKSAKIVMASRDYITSGQGMISRNGLFRFSARVRS
jgi:hypothetical protein